MQSAARLFGTVCADAFVELDALGCANADSNTRQTRAAKNGSLVRNVCVVFNVACQFLTIVIAHIFCSFFILRYLCGLGFTLFLQSWRSRRVQWRRTMS